MPSDPIITLSPRQTSLDEEGSRTERRRGCGRGRLGGGAPGQGEGVGVRVFGAWVCVYI